MGTDERDVPCLLNGVGQHARRHDLVADPLFGPNQNVAAGEILAAPDRLRKRVVTHVGGGPLQSPWEFGPSLDQPAGGQQGLGAVVMGIHVFGRAVDERAKGVKRVFNPPQFIESRGQVEVN